MTVVVTPLHWYYSESHLLDVVAAMRELGPPRIRAFLDLESGAWLAREGTHRLRAALLLELAPVLVPIRWWRTRSALERARFAALERGHVFARVQVRPRDRDGRDSLALVSDLASEPSRAAPRPRRLAPPSVSATTHLSPPVHGPEVVRSVGSRGAPGILDEASPPAAPGTACAPLASMDNYKIRHSHGQVDGGLSSYEDARAAVRAVYGADAAIGGYGGDLEDGGEASLCWQSDVPEADRDGSRACCEIRRVEVQS